MKKSTILLSLIFFGLVCIFGYSWYTKKITLPFAPPASASVAKATLQESRHKRRVEVSHLEKDAPNVIVILMDDVGFGQPTTFGGEITTTTLSRIRDSGIAYNTFHTTAICSPTRASLLTGRNHHRVGSGTIAERSVDWDGYTGVIPKTSATVAEVLRQYGYRTAALGKWHNTPTQETTEMGPFHRWPMGYGFDYFYGFLAGETSQYRPRLFENTNPVEPAASKDYHLSRDLADKAIQWLRKHRSYAPEKPFFLYFAPGAGHSPHQVFKELSDQYKGKFDDGWDAYRERVFARQKEQGWIPNSAKLTERPDTMPSWDEIPEEQKPFQRRLMEVFAGFVSYTDAQIGRVIDELEDLGVRDNTVVFYIWGDNGASPEGINRTINEFFTHNDVDVPFQEQMEILDSIGGLDAIGGPKLDNSYHSAWAWAAGVPFQHTKLVASHFGGTRNPLVISWPKKIRSDRRPRSQFHHVNDIAPTIYEIVGIDYPHTVNGYQQDPIDGISMVYTFANPDAQGQKQTQYFDNNGSRGIYHKGWYAGTFGPVVPWQVGQPELSDWDAREDQWELYNLNYDFSQSQDLAVHYPEKVKQMRELFIQEAKENKVFPIGAALLTRIDSSTRIESPYRSWVLDQTTRRMPEFAAPGLGRHSNIVVLDVDIDSHASGVLYALGGYSGGLCLFLEKGKLVYEYNMLLKDRYRAESERVLSAGSHQIEVETRMVAEPGGPATVVVRVDGEEVAKTVVKETVAVAFTASETLDIGIDLGSPVTESYFDQSPYPLEGSVKKVTVDLL